jgi:V8-like Glu-specific endopeptidase
MKLARACMSAIACFALTSLANAQITFDAPQGEIIEYQLDSGMKMNVAGEPGVAFRTVVHQPRALWTRLYFQEAQLSPGSSIRMTSLLDGEVQQLDAAGLAMWNYSSAYFNGDSVLVELIAAADMQPNRMVIDRVAILQAPEGFPIGSCGICGGDSRVPSDEDWAGRLMPVGCSASIYNTQSCVVSAGHCMGSANVMQFRVPNSTAGCNTQNPPVADQFPVTGTLWQDTGVGGDWAALTTGTNNLGQSAYQRYGEYRPIATNTAPTGAPVSVWGYGFSNTCTLTYTQQLSQGTITQITSDTYRAQIDVTFGNSGSALIWNNQIIGVVTHCASCASSGNIMNRIDAPAFVNARNTLCPSAPDNDTCPNAVTVSNGSISFSNAGATTSGPNEPGLCNLDGDSQVQADVWFSYTATCTGEVTFSLCDGDQPSPGGPCADSCGAQAPDGCWCDEQCDGFGDCCPGVCDDCPTLSHCEPPAGDCAGNCGGQAPDGCWCDEQCDGFGDCCPGVCDDCPGLSHCDAPAGPCAGNCGGQADGCWCDEQCDGFGDCCEGVCNDCPELSHCGGLGGGGVGTGGSGNGFDTKMAIYNACPSGSGQVIACNNDSCGVLSSITINATAGETFIIRIGGHNGDTGNGILTISCEETTPACDGDLNSDSVVNVSDLLILLGAWGNCSGCAEDLNNDGVVNVSDLLILLGNWGACP